MRAFSRVAFIVRCKRLISRRCCCFVFFEYNLYCYYGVEEEIQQSDFNGCSENFTGFF